MMKVDFGRSISESGTVKPNNLGRIILLVDCFFHAGCWGPHFVWGFQGYKLVWPT